MVCFLVYLLYYAIFFTDIVPYIRQIKTMHVLKSNIVKAYHFCRRLFEQTRQITNCTDSFTYFYLLIPHQSHIMIWTAQQQRL